MGISNLFFVPFLVAAVCAYIFGSATVKLAWKFGIIDDPKRHIHPKVIHKEPIPRAGGLALYAAVLVATLVFIPVDKHLAGILAGATLLTGIGLADDYLLSRGKDMSPYTRLALQFLAASMPIIAGIGIAFWRTPFGQIIDLSHPQLSFVLMGESRSIWIASDLFALFWIVTIVNFVNMGAKGVDGQLSGVVTIAATTIALLSLSFSADITEWPVIVLAAITAGAFFGFLPWNSYPQKIMPSFAGSNLGGYLLAVLSILTTAKVGTLALVLGIPLIDTGYTVVRRIMAGRSPVWGDRGHLHHRLLDAGWSKPQVTYFYWLVTAVLGTMALRLNAENKLYTIVGTIFLVGGLILWLTYRPKR